MAEFEVPQIDYTSRDFEGIRDDFIRLIPFFTAEWTDFNPSDHGIVLAELQAYVGDILHFYLDRRAAEAFLPTAITRQAVVNLLKLIDFDLAGKSAASVDVQFTLPSAQPVDVLIPKGTEVQTVGEEGESVVSFETVADLTILAGPVVGTVSALEGKTSNEIPDPSDGSAFQKRVLLTAGILEDSLRFFIDETGSEEEWFEVESLSGQLATAKVFSTARDENDIITVTFGDDAQGKIPIPGATMRAELRTGGGIVGNVGAGTITKLISSIISQGQPLGVTVTNLLAASGGEEEQTIEEAKRLAPLTLRAQDRGVSLTDLSTLAEGVAGVAKAKAFLGDLPLEVKVVVSPAGGGQPSQALLDDVEAELDEKKCAGTFLIVQGPVEIGIDLTAAVIVLPTFVQADVQAAVVLALADYFSVDKATIDFGLDINLSDITALIDNVDGVDHVDITILTMFPNDSLDITFTGDLTFTAIAVSPTTVDETWTIAFTGATTYTVTGSVSGLQAATGVVDTPYVSDSAEVAFTIESGTIGNTVGDRATFRTSEQLGNIEINGDELAIVRSQNLTFSGGA